VRQLPVRQILRWTAYPLFFLVCFVFFAYKTFPYDRLAARIVQMAQLQGYELEIGDLTHSGMTGLTFDDLRVIVPSADEGSPPTDVVFDELTLSTTLLSLISEVKSYSFFAELAGGQAEGDVTIGENVLDVDAEIDDIDLSAISALPKFAVVPLAGTLNGEISLAMPSEIGESTGNLEITVEGLNIGDGKSKVDIPGWGGLTLDQADAGDLELVATIEEGIARIERATAHGKDLELDALGKARLGRPFNRTELDIMVRVKIEDAYKARSDKVATMLELASSGLKAALTKDGAIQYAVAGPVGPRLRARPAGAQPFEAPK